MRQRRRFPSRITLLLWLVLIITASSAIRAYAGIAWRSALLAYVPANIVTYIAVSGAFWTGVWLVVFWCFWRAVHYTRQIVVGSAVLYAAWMWIDRLLVQAGPAPNWPFALVATILLLGYTFAIVLDPRNKDFFRKETYERKPERPPTS